MSPNFKSAESVDDMNLFYKFLVDATVQAEMYKNFRAFSTKNDYVKAITLVYEKMFMSVFSRLINFTDYNRDYEHVLAYSVNFYVLKVLLDKPFNIADSMAKNAVKQADPELIGEVFGNELDKIESFGDYYEVLNKTIFNVSSIRADSVRKINNFIKQYTLFYPTLIFGIDMIQVMTGGVLGYLKGKSFDSTYARLNNLIFKKEKNAMGMLNSSLTTMR